MLILWAYIVSLLYVALSLGLCGLLCKCLSKFTVRKILHIFMASWWFIRIYFLDASWLWLGPTILSSILIVYSKKKGIKRGMGSFCFSLALMTYGTEIDVRLVTSATAAILTMGYADAAAALVGSAYQKHKNINKPYSWAGSFAFLIVASIVINICMAPIANVLHWVIVAAVITLVEAKILSKHDNLTVPFLTFLLTIATLYYK